MKPDLFIFLVAAITAVVCSCAAPKALVVGPPPPVKKKKEVASVPMVSPPAAPVAADDGPRMPDMLTMPTEGEFKPTNPGAIKSEPGGNAVISHPPTDPPSRVRPKEPKAE